MVFESFHYLATCGINIPRKQSVTSVTFEGLWVKTWGSFLGMKPTTLSGDFSGLMGDL